jgi:hypothetical protein
VVALEEERDFCLRSLRDLEAELAAGDLDQADYDVLRDSYMVRAAAVLRKLDGGDVEGGMGPASSGEVQAGGGPDVSISPDGPAGPAGGGDLGAPDGSMAGGRTAGAGEASPPAGLEAPEGSMGAARTGGAGEASPPAALGAVAALASPATPAATDIPVGPMGDESVPARSAIRATWQKRVLIGACVVAVAAGAAWAVAASSGTRLPGQEITGQAVGSQAEVQYLQQAQQAADRGDGVTALKDYQKVLNRDPTQPEALAGEGWLLAQTQQPTLLRQGLTMLAAAEQAAPTYAPAHLYRGISLLSESDYSGAIPELQWYLAHNPDPQLAPRVRTALRQAQAQVKAAPSGG